MHPDVRSSSEWEQQQRSEASAGILSKHRRTSLVMTEDDQPLRGAQHLFQPSLEGVRRFIQPQSHCSFIA